ncbi:protein yellow-like [Cloeon dipterum]|uniref:protein yellow-like n=1 Tax=Cloeon dipterum TaxID=197152 RepID=UPI00321FCAAE
MAPFLVAIFLLGLSSLTTGANFNQVFQWDELDYEWPSEAKRTQALENGSFKPENMLPLYIALHGTRLFISLHKENGVPATLVSLPTGSASSAPPKLTPFPSWDMHLNGTGNCSKIRFVEGLQVDSVGRLWALNLESPDCNTTLMIFNLNTDEIELIHRFPSSEPINDFVIDETASGTFAYISRSGGQRIVVFSLERNESWTVDTPGIEESSAALSLKEEQLYLGNMDSKELFSIPVAALRNGTRTSNPKLIGKWTGKPYKMLIDNHGTMYATFDRENYISSWITAQPFQEQRFHEVTGLNFSWPYTLALDQNGTLWVTVFDQNRKPKYRLLKAAVGGKSFKAAA